MNVRGDDRRQGPRREVDACLHYTTQALLAAALDVAEGYGHLNTDPETLLGALKAAAANYQAAEQAVEAAVMS